jgi:hypothetical protein
MQSSDAENPNMHIIRTYSGGVHVGTLKHHDGKTVVLTDASRIWRWRGGDKTPHELALHGPAQEWACISERVPEITLTEAIEIIPVNPEARAAFAPRWSA